MAGATDLFETDLLDLIFNNVDCANVGNVGGLLKSSADGSYSVTLHTGTLLDTHTLNTQFEAAYTGYSTGGIAVSRTNGWTVSGTAPTIASNVAAITFGASTSSETETDVGLAGNSTVLQIYSPLDASLSVTSGVTPEFAIGALDISLD